MVAAAAVLPVSNGVSATPRRLNQESLLSASPSLRLKDIECENARAQAALVCAVSWQDATLSCETLVSGHRCDTAHASCFKPSCT